MTSLPVPTSPRVERFVTVAACEAETTAADNKEVATRDDNLMVSKEGLVVVGIAPSRAANRA
jgi:hypothetical protein